MISKLIIGAGVLIAITTSSCLKTSKNEQNENVAFNQTVKAKSIHSLKARRLLSDEEIELSVYKGHPLLIVNTASKCGLTPQYKDLQALHEKYAEKGLKILGFPSNDFLGQEPGTEEEIASFCQKNYGVDFDMFQKVKVKGKKKHPIYQFLTQKEKNGVLDSKVKWNFQKYLLDKDGKLITVINPKTKINDEEVIKKIEELL